MKRIYSNYSDEDCKLISREAQKLGFSLSAYLYKHSEVDKHFYACGLTQAVL